MKGDLRILKVLEDHTFGDELKGKILRTTSSPAHIVRPPTDSPEMCSRS